jgi:hypothetical protein
MTILFRLVSNIRAGRSCLYILDWPEKAAKTNHKLFISSVSGKEKTLYNIATSFTVSVAAIATSLQIFWTKVEDRVKLNIYKIWKEWGETQLRLPYSSLKDIVAILV